MHFVIPATNREILEHYPQDEELYHHVDKLILPSHTQRKVEIVMVAKLTFESSEWYFGCEGRLDEKPQPISHFNPFIKRGQMKELSPDTSDAHYIGSDDYYHITGSRVRSLGEVYVSGFIVKTRSPGDYEARVFFGGIEKRRIGTLAIEVNDGQSRKMRCVVHENCEQSPVIPDNPGAST